MLFSVQNHIDPAKFYQALYEGILKEDVNAILSLAHSIWHLPISVIDMHYDNLGMFPWAPIGDPTYDAIIAEGKITRSMVQNFLDGKYMLEIIQHEEPYLIDYGITRVNHRLAYRLYENGVFYGAVSLVLLNDYQWTEEDSALLKQMAPAFIQIMSKRHFGLRSQRSVEHWLMTTLLETGYLNHDSIELLEKKFCRPGMQWFQLVRLADGPTTSPYHQDYLEHRISLSFPGMFTCQSNNRLYLLLQGLNKGALSELLCKLRPFMGADTPYVIGVSRPFRDLRQIACCRSQADFVFEHGIKTGNSGIFLYQDYVLEHVLSILDEHLPENCLNFDPIQKLKKYDQDNGSHHTETLQFYLLSMMDKQKTIDHFNIHRNTLLHRLTRIQEIIGLDFDDTTQIYEMALAFLLQEYQEHSSSIHRSNP